MRTRITAVRRSALRVAAFMIGSFCAAHADAQSKLPIRQIGKLERVSTDPSLSSIASAIAMPGGRVLINDRVGRRVLLLDSTLADEKIVADTTASTGESYGRRADGLIHFRGDSALLIDESTLSMYVIAPNGLVARVMAIPRAGDAQELIFGAAIDSRNRMIYFDSFSSAQGVLMLNVGNPICKDARSSSATADGGGGAVRAWIADACLNHYVDSMPLVRIDLATRAFDTIAHLEVPKLRRSFKLDDNGGLIAIETTYDPLPIADAWVVTSDGTVAVLRTADYHMDWLDAAGKWTSSPKLPFDWQTVDDARKAALIDSTATYWQEQNDRIMNGGGRGGLGAMRLAPLVAKRAAPGTLPDYFPPIIHRGDALSADADGNVWIRTTAIADHRPVYDVVNRRGELIDRVQLPPSRTVAGFGPGVIYMAVQDAAGKVHLERARVH